jgi:hypothetical protein
MSLDYRDPSTNVSRLHNERAHPDKDRCRYTNKRGVRCDYRVIDPTTNLCVIHIRKLERRIEEHARKRADRLFEEAGKLKSRDQVQPFLVNLMRLLVEGELERQDAAVLAYVCSLILQTLPSRKAKPAEKKVEIIWDLLAPDQVREQDTAKSREDSAGSAGAENRNDRLNN